MSNIYDFTKFASDANFVQEGYDAAKAGKPRSDNPYKENSTAANQWAKGFNERKLDEKEGKTNS